MAAIPFVFCAVLSLILLQANAQKNVSCSPSVTSVCASCKTQTICPVSSGTNTSSSCISGQVCKYDSGLATCTDPANVAGCKCNSSGSTITFQCDFYDSQISLACYKGAIQSATVCKITEVCNKVTGKCSPPPPTTVSPPSTSTETTSTPVICGPDEGLVNKNNCTSIAFCSEGMPPNIQNCDPGQIFSSRVNSCVNYTSSFICPEPIGVFPDPFNCSIVHTCKNNIDSISLCPNGQNFDSDLRKCTNESVCPPEQCTPCTSAKDIFPVNETTCVPEYKQCSAVVNPESDNFELKDRSCPDTYVFDPKKKACFSKCSFFRNSWNSFG